ncbi:MAG TPA: glycosyl hydrolase, partial [Blastocatellia bacterium]|nr:glycosyl hydrolase [Blastocatellia bacterium]
GIVIATRRKPALAPGFKSTESEQQQINEISRRLFDGATAKGHLVADEKTLGAKLNSLFQPDVAFSSGKADLGFIHRRTPEAEIYFIANTSSTKQQVKATFRVKGLNPEIWDTFTGRVSPVIIQGNEAGGFMTLLDLAPYDSRVIVFTKRTLPGEASLFALNSSGTPIDLSNGWRVSFGEKGQPTSINDLRSWTENEETLYYSGTATYEKEFTFPENLLTPGRSAVLDFGEGQAIEPTRLTNGMRAWYEGPVREAAVVYINGERAGSVWRPPYRLDIAKFLKPGQNQIKVIVGNTAINHMAGRKLPDYKLLILRYGDRFQPQDMDKVKPLPSGLTGKIQLIVTPKRLLQ